jgi:predicted RNase H-like HicB family nuclease
VMVSSMTKSFTALFTREGDGFVALCPEIDVVSQGDSVEGAMKNLTEAVQLFSSETFVSSLEVQFG